MASGWDEVSIDQKDGDGGKRIFNFETGAMLWDSNARAATDKEHPVGPPPGLPLWWEALHKIRKMAVGQALWFVSISCPFCISFGMALCGMISIHSMMGTSSCHDFESDC